MHKQLAIPKIECYVTSAVFKNEIQDAMQLTVSYTAASDRFETSTKLVRICLVFTRDLVDLARIGSAIWYQRVHL